MTIKEKVEKHKKAITIYLLLVVVVAMVPISVAVYQRGYEDGRSDLFLDPYSSVDQWFAVNHSFARVYKWEITGNNTWRFHWEWVPFENMTGLHFIQFPLNGNMWTDIPFGLVRTPDTVKIQPIEE